jgi:hypothetical protein
MTSLRKNMIVVPSDSPAPNQVHERVSLFNPDGSPFSGGGGGGGSGKELLVASYYKDPNGPFTSYVNATTKTSTGVQARYRADNETSAFGLILGSSANSYISEKVTFVGTPTQGPGFTIESSGILELEFSYWVDWDPSATNKKLVIAADVASETYAELNTYMSFSKQCPSRDDTINASFTISKELTPIEDNNLWSYGLWVQSEVSEESFTIRSASLRSYWTPMPDLPDLSALF